MVHSYAEEWRNSSSKKIDDVSKATEKKEFSLIEELVTVLKDLKKENKEG